MDTTAHYLTVATFQLKGKEEGLNEVTIDDHMNQKALIRKLCICGSGIHFMEDGRKWICSASGSELEISHSWSCTPLLARTELGQPALYVSELNDPQSKFVVNISDAGELRAFLKIEAKNRWVISDPLSVFEHLSVKPFETDLLLTWFLDVEDHLTSGLSFRIAWDITDPLHRKTVELLASSKTINLYFVDASSLSLIGVRTLDLYQPNVQTEVTKAIALNAALPKDKRERREQLSSIALGREASMLAFADQMGLCPNMTRYLFHPTSESPEVISQHIKSCPLCQHFQSS